MACRAHGTDIVTAWRAEPLMLIGCILVCLEVASSAVYMPKKTSTERSQGMQHTWRITPAGSRPAAPAPHCGPVAATALPQSRNPDNLTAAAAAPGYCVCCASQIIDHNSSGLGVSHLLLPLLSVCVSVSAGLLGGAIISLTLHHQLHNRLAGALLGAHLLPGHSHASVAHR